MATCALMNGIIDTVHPLPVHRGTGSNAFVDGAANGLIVIDKFNQNVLL